jgi:hypothetical protein
MVFTRKLVIVPSFSSPEAQQGIFWACVEECMVANFGSLSLFIPATQFGAFW